MMAGYLTPSMLNKLDPENKKNNGLEVYKR